MRRKVVMAIGLLLLLAGLLGFLASAVALATADEMADIQTPEGVELRLAPDDPKVAERKRQAEVVLFGSFLCGGGGVVLVAIGIWLGSKAR